MSGVGARTVRALAMVAEGVHGAPCRFTDPALFSLAHGGKDRHPYPVPTLVYDRTIEVMKSAVRKAKLGNEEELGAIRRLSGAAARTDCHRAFGCGAYRGGTRAVPRIRRTQRVPLGAAAGGCRSGCEMTAMLDLFDAPLLPGLATQNDFVTEGVEQVLIAAIDAADLSPFQYHGWTGKRLTVAYGWSYASVPDNCGEAIRCLTG